MSTLLEGDEPLTHSDAKCREAESGLAQVRKDGVEQVVAFLRVQPSPQRPSEEILIVNILLPDSKSFKDIGKSTVAVGLGYVVQLLQLMSFILDRPLPCHMLFRGSRSAIGRSVSEYHYPLYVQRGNSSEFETALEMLAVNLRVLAESQGLKYQGQSLVRVLLELVRYPHIGYTRPLRPPARPTVTTEEDENDFVLV